MVSNNIRVNSNTDVLHPERKQRQVSVPPTKVTEGSNDEGKDMWSTGNPDRIINQTLEINVNLPFDA